MTSHRLKDAAVTEKNSLLLNPVFKLIKTEVVFSTGDADSDVSFESSSLWWINLSIISFTSLPSHYFCHYFFLRFILVVGFCIQPFTAPLKAQAQEYLTIEKKNSYGWSGVVSER